MWPPAGIEGFLALWGASYLGHLVVYFGLGGILVCLNRFMAHKQIPAANGGPRRARRTTGQEMVQSLKSLSATSFCLAGGLYVQAHGWAQTPLELTPLTAVLTFCAAVVLHDAWFYFGHRLMHTKRLYKWHKTHHLSVTPTVWNNDSFSIPDALSVQSFFLALPFLLPIPPAVLVFCRLFDQTKGMIGHSGFEYFANATARWPLPLVATVHHDYHHQRFTVNFANQFTFWDRLFGTLDSGYDARVTEMAKRSPETVRPETTEAP